MTADAVPATRARAAWILALLALLFLFRLAFGLASNFWTEDERQIYLIGLRFFATGRWPFFGPDIVWTGTEIPGALQGLLVGLPLFVLRIPEAPFLLVNLLSFGALALLAWYCARRLPEVPSWFIWGWLMTAPWTLNFSTHVVNPSYVLPAAVVFFVGFFEAFPPLRGGLLPVPLSWAMMGAAVPWILQVHMAWVLLPPYVVLAAAWSLADAAERRRLPAALLACALGAAATASALVPTLVRYGFSEAGRTQHNIHFAALGPLDLVSTLARFLSFACYEMPRFVGLDSASRLYFFAAHPWLAPLAFFLAVVGFAQPLALVALSFRRVHPHPEWRTVKLVALGTALWVYVSYFFSAREPQAHAFYVTLPVAMIFSFYAWALLATRPGWRRFAQVVLVAGVAFQAAFAAVQAPVRSLYWDRRVPLAAIGARDERILGQRRQSARLLAARVEGPDPRPLPGAANGTLADARADIDIVGARWRPAVGGRVSRWDVVLRNRSTLVAYSDIRYTTTYLTATGATAGTGGGIVKFVIEPGETRAFPEIIDGLTRDGAVRGEIAIAGGEQLVAIPR